MKKPIYFTINTPECGFTDQMMQFNAFYKLGRSLGYKYVHTPFQTSRCLAINQTRVRNLLHRLRKPMDVYDFLRFNRYMQTKSESLGAECEISLVEIALGSQAFLQNRDASFAALLHYIDDIVVRHKSSRRTLLVRFSLEGHRGFFALIHSRMPELPDNLDLASAFHRIDSPTLPASQPQSGKSKILIHIRQGDTAVLNTPWGTYIPVDSRRKGWMQEHINSGLIGPAKEILGPVDLGSVFTIRDYFDFVEALFAELHDANFSVQVFSDGFKRAFKILLSHIDLLRLESKQVKLLRKLQRQYDKKQFHVFRHLKNCQQFIGETDKNLRMMLYAMLESDIVIIGTQQRMLPKFFANYRLNNMPIVIVLYKGHKPDFSVVANGWNDSFIFVDLREPNILAIANKLRQFMKSGSQSSG